MCYLLAEGKRKTRLLGSLSKVLLLHRKVTNSESVLRHVALERARAVMDLERSAIRLVRRRRGGVILGMKETRDRGAALARNPKVGRASVKHNLERLGRCSQSDFGVVLCVEVV